MPVIQQSAFVQFREHSNTLDHLGNIKEAQLKLVNCQWKKDGLAVGRGEKVKEQRQS